ncbi:acyltransferase family protein [Anaerosacchariphilus polymeriproducens]|uniref:Acyltransferase n=1 Tax=Anaerosacchariphilus polymeriproducens TaxID=1812858 RepID=A0A371AVN6_9FIRM|nr:acyltransferase family protein [Anaerosacchariphilus polymeriproducens]RDU23633.1 acyltransferase [Anaerosacchariphilus polymeriproducens]
MRKYYIDNIRILCILLLIPFHAAMIFNSFGENWYIHSQENSAATLFIVGIYPWWMSGLFVLAGMSSVYALKKRTVRQYIKERFLKLFLPFLSALALLIPVQPYIADQFFNNYHGNYFEHLSIFFTLTDWTGYDGHFTPGHTWFILYLFLISLISIPFMVWNYNREKKIIGTKMTMLKLLLLFVIPLIATPILNIGGKSVGGFAAYFLLGYFILSMEEVQVRLEKYCMPLGIVWIIMIVIYCSLYQSGMKGIFSDIVQNVFSWIGILAMIGLGKRFLNFNNCFTKYFAPASFPIYIFHQSIIVIVGYVIVQRVQLLSIQYISIVISSFLLTIIMYELCKRIAVTRFLFGIKR